MSDVYLTGQNGRRVQLARVKQGGWTRARRKRFLDVLATTCNVTTATAAAGMKGKSAYDLRKRDPAFAALWQEALALGYETLERAVLRGALAGVNAIAIEGAAALGDEGDDAGDGAGDGGGAAGAAADAFGHAAPGSGVPRVPADLARLQFALALLNRYRAVVAGDDRRGRARRITTAAETDALLRRKLDLLARQLAARTGRSEPDEPA